MVMWCPKCGEPLHLSHLKKKIVCRECEFTIPIDDWFEYLREKRREMEGWEATPKEERKEQNKPCSSCECIEICLYGINQFGRERLCMQN
jgi:uncharacterized protein YbaR (Trm112 family)